MFRQSLFVFLGVLCISNVDADICGTVTINEYGQDTTRYIASTYCPGISGSGTTISLPHDAQIQIAQNDSTSYNPEMFVWYTLDV